jgi:hypothetical protein
MRKHKSVVAILLAVMMIFTFMPTMAFAQQVTEDTTTYDWAPDFTSVTVNGTTTYNAKSYLDPATNVTVAYVDSSSTLPGGASIYYYNLTSAVAQGKGAYSDFVFAQTGRVPNVDRVAYNAMVADGLDLYLGENKIGYSEVNWKANVTGTELEEFDGNKEMTLTADFKAVSTKDNDGKTYQTPVLYGTPVTFKVNVIGKTTPAAPTDKTFYIDGNKKVAFDYSVEYDGASHTLELLPVTGYTAKYEVYNKTTGLWTATTAIEFKDVQTKGYDDYRGYYVNDSTGKKDANFGYATVTPRVYAADAMFSFEKDGNGGEFTYNVTAGSLWSADQFIGAYNYTSSGWTQSVSPVQKAVTADQDALLAYFKDFYEITQKSTEAHPEVITLTFKSKNLSADEVKALNKTHEKVIANFYITDATSRSQFVRNGDFSATATVNCITDPNTKEDDITFLTVPNKTIKVKKAKKTKKAVSFAVEASAKSGKALTYQLTTPNKKIVIDPATGVITVKKGVKKGTYKVTVKATTEDGNGYKAAKESASLTIKVKK